MTNTNAVRLRYDHDRKLLTIVAPTDAGEALDKALRAEGFRASRLFQESADPMTYVTLFLALPGAVNELMRLAQTFVGNRSSHPETYIRAKTPEGGEVEAHNYDAAEVVQILEALRGPSQED